MIKKNKKLKPNNYPLQSTSKDTRTELLNVSNKLNDNENENLSQLENNNGNFN